MSDSNSLKDYQGKRDFAKTREPRGSRSTSAGAPVFVIQQHDASRLHFDFRLEVDGVLKSWAVPKGPSTDPREKRLAIPTEDHPLEYADFEGVIPEDSYGGGTVLLWDKGTYENIKKDEDGSEISLKKCLEDGHLTVWLKGEKLEGGYALIRMDSGDQERWLLVKMDDDKADARRNPVSTEPHSVASGLDLGEITANEKDD